jgi:hypothetical protein
VTACSVLRWADSSTPLSTPGPEVSDEVCPPESTSGPKVTDKVRPLESTSGPEVTDKVRPPESPFGPDPGKLGLDITGYGEETPLLIKHPLIGVLINTRLQVAADININTEFSIINEPKVGLNQPKSYNTPDLRQDVQLMTV